jgi:hypothetical protein
MLIIVAQLSMARFVLIDEACRRCFDIRLGIRVFGGSIQNKNEMPELGPSTDAKPEVCPSAHQLV